MESQKYKYIVDCVHKAHLVNQGITMCMEGKDLDQCDTCPLKESYGNEYTITATSSKVVNYYDM